MAPFILGLVEWVLPSFFTMSVGLRKYCLLSKNNLDDAFAL